MEELNKKDIVDAVKQAEKKIDENASIEPPEMKKKSSTSMIILLMTIMILSMAFMSYRLYDINNIPEQSETEIMMNAKAILYFSVLSIENFRNRENRLPHPQETEIISDYVDYSLREDNNYIIAVKLSDTVLVYSSGTDEFPEMPVELGAER